MPRIDFSARASARLALLALVVVLSQTGIARAASPPNDAFANATPFTGASGSVTSTTDQATAEAGEPKVDPAISVSPRRTVWYRWTAPADGPATFAFCGFYSSSLPQIAVYTGAAVGGLTRVATGAPALASGRCGASTSGADAVDFVATAGTTYRVQVEAALSYSQQFTLALNPAPANDAIGAAATLTAAAQANTMQATQEVGEPDHGGGTVGTRSVWYQLSSSFTSETRRISTCDSDFDTTLAVYARNGAGVGGVSLVARSDDSDACGPGAKQSSVVFTSSPGVVYLVAVAGRGAAAGIARVAIAVPADDLVLASPIGLQDEQTGTTVGATRQTGETMFAGRGRHSVWGTFTNDEISRTVILSTCAGLTDTLLGVYTGGGDGTPASLVKVVENDDATGCGTDGKGSRVRFTALPDTRYVVLVDSPAGAAGPFRLRSTSNDDIAQSSYLWGDGSGTAFDNGGATAEPSEAAHGGQPASHSVWFRFWADRATTYTFDTCDTRFDTTLSVYRAPAPDRESGESAPTMGGLTAVGDNDDSTTCGSNGGSRVAVRNTTPDTYYYIAVDGHAGATGTAKLNVISNDDRADAVPLAWPLSYVYRTVWTGGATLEPGEPDHAGQGSPHSAWYTFTPTSDQRLAFQAIPSCASSGDVTPPLIVAVYTAGSDGKLVPAGSGTSTSTSCSSARTVVAAHAGTQYWVAVASAGTGGASFYFGAAGPPSNDDFGSPTPLPGVGGYPTSATNELASKQAGEADHAGAAGGASLWWSYAPTTDERVVLNVCNSFASTEVLDSVIAVYEGTSLTTLQAVASNDDGSGPGCTYAGQTEKASRVAFDAKAGHQYRIAVDGKGGSRGSFYLQRVGPPSNDARASAQSLGFGYGGVTYGSTELATAETGEPAHAGSPAAHSVWYQVTPYSSSPYLVGTCRRSTAPNRIAVYRMSGGALSPVASSGPTAGCAGGAGARVRITTVAYETLYIAVDASSTASSDFTLGVDVAPANDAFASAINLYDYSGGTSSFDTSQASREDGEPDHADAGGGSSVWFTWSTSTAGPVQFDTCSYTSYDSAVAAYTQGGSGVAGLQKVVANDDATGCGDGHGSRVQFDAAVGKTYYIAVDGHGGASGPGRLAVWRAPYNDNIANALDYGNDLVANGSNRIATAEAGEPAHAGAPAAASVWFKLNGRGRWVIDTCGSSFDTRLAVYRGADAQHLTPVASNDDAPGCGAGGSRVSFSATTTGSERLWVALDGKNGATGDFGISASPSNDDFASAQPITTTRATPSTYLGRATAETGEPAHDGAPAARSVWYRWVPDRGGPALVRACGTGFRAGVYTGASVGALTPVPGTVTHAVPTASSSAPPSTSGPSTTVPPVTSSDSPCGGTAIRFAAVAGTTYWIAMEAPASVLPSLSTYADYGWLLVALAPANDDRANAQVIPAAGTTVNDYDEAATRESGEPDHASAGGAHSVWYRWTPGIARSVTVSTCGSSYDTALGVYKAGDGGGLTEVARDDDGAPGPCGARTSRLRFRADATTTYWIAVDGHDGASGSYSLELAPAPANDDVAAAQQVTSGAVVSATTRNATAETGEPSHGGTGGASVWYRFTAPRTGSVAFSTCGSVSDTLLAAYSGTAVAALAQLASSDDDVRCGTGYHGSRISFPAVKDTSYLIAVDARGGEGGTFTLRADPPANDDFEDAETLAASASAGGGFGSASTQPGEPVSTSGGSVWYRWTAPATRTVELTTCGSPAGLAVFAGSALSGLVKQTTTTPSGRSCRSGGTILQLAAVKDRAYVIQVAGYGSHRLQVAPPANDRIGSAQVLTGQHVSVTGTTVGASPESDEPQTTSDRAVWYRWTASDAGVALADVCDSDVPTRVMVFRAADANTYTSVPDAGGAPGCAAGARGAQIAFQTVKDAVYYIAVDGEAVAGGAFTLVFDANIDTDPPETTLTSKPATPTNAYSPSFSFTSDEAGSTFECALDAAAYASCSPPWSLSGVAEGTHTFRVRARDKAGNADLTPESYLFVVDRTPPVAKLDKAPPALGRATTAEVQFSANEAGTTFTCRWDGATAAACTSPQTRTGLADGTHTFAVVPTDPAGNAGSAVTATFRIDTTPPVTSLSGGPDDPTRQTTASQAFAANEASTYQCALDAGAFAACASPWSVTGLPDGRHTIYVRATDTAGNVETTAAARSFTVDTKAPDTAIETPPPALVKTLPALTLTATEEGATFACRVDDGEWVACDSSWTPGAMADGTHTVSVRATDRAGNADATAATATFTYDTTPPAVTLDGVPAAHITAATATLRFHADEAGSSFECALDHAGFTPCTSPWTTGALAEGAHALSVRATDPAGNTGAEVVATSIVDRTVPETTIDEPTGHYTNAQVVKFGFSASETSTFECRMGTAAFAPCSSPTAVSGLGEGEYTFAVRARDEAGNLDPTPATFAFVVDRTPPDTSIDEAPTTPVHRDEGSFAFSSTDDGDIECQIDDGVWSDCTLRPYSTWHMPILPPGAHTLRVRATDSAGNVDPTPAQTTFTVVDVAPTLDMDVTPVDGEVPLDVTVDLRGDDADDDPLAYTVDYGDGSQDSGAGGDHEIVDHRYAKAGTYVLRAEVSDGSLATVRTKVIHVSPSEPLDARAGDDRTVTAGAPVRFDAGDSRPQAGIDGIHWDFGDGATSSEVVTDHAYSRAGTYTATLTVTLAGDERRDTVTVRVLPDTAPSLDVTVQQTGGAPLAGADVAVIAPDGTRVAGVSGADGVTKLRGLADGKYSVAAYAPGHLPARADATIASGHGAVTITLAAGELAKVEMSSHRMTREEILAAGIDPNDPANQHVFVFNVELELEDPAEPSTSGTGYLGWGGGGGGGGWHFIGGGGRGLTCSLLRCRGQSKGAAVYITPQVVEGQPMLAAMVIPFRVKWLKEFFDISMTIHNLADPSFSLTHGVATIDVPDGLSLAPTRAGQHQTVQMPEIKGGDQATAHWILRGDVEGSYDVGATYGAVLDPIGRSFTMRGTLDDPLKVWGGSALKLTVDVDDTVSDGHPFAVKVGLRNVSDVPVYNPSVELLKAGRVGYIEQPRQQDEFVADEIAPGDTFWAGPFVLVPDITGKIDLSRSVLRKVAGDVDLQRTLVAHVRTPAIADDPKLTAIARDHGMVLKYEDAPGAKSYEAYATSADRKSDFPTTPLDMRPVKAGYGYIPSVSPEDDRVYALSTISATGRRMVHPVATQGALSAPAQPAVTTTVTSACGERPVQLKLAFDDDVFPLTRYRWRLEGDDDWTDGGALTGSHAEAFPKVNVPKDKALTYEVQVHNALEGADGQGIWGPVEKLTLGGCPYVAMGDSFSSGEGVRPYQDGTDMSGTDVYGSTNKCHRSKLAYPLLLTGVDTPTHIACSGALVGDGLHPWDEHPRHLVDGKPDGKHKGVGAQIDKVSKATKLVTISMGGNDIYFADVLSDCFFGGVVTWFKDPTLDPRKAPNLLVPCKTSWAKRVADARFQLEDDLHDLLLRIRLKAADNARIIVMGYPQIFPKQQPNNINCVPWFHEADVNWFHRVAAGLNESVERAAATAGVEFVDPNTGGRFDGHSVCDWDSYFNNIFRNMNVPRGELEFVHQEESMHPNHLGQEALAAAMQEAIDDPPGSHAAVLKYADSWDFLEPVLDDWDVFGVRIGWPGSTMRLKLTSPSGRVIDTDTVADDVEAETTPTSAAIRVRRPEAGHWKVRVEAVDVAPGGEPVTASVDHVAHVNAPPVAIGTADVTGTTAPGTQVSYDASKSFDSDDGIVTYRWTFDDGAVATGAKVTHAYATVGEHVTKLTVIDAAGAEDSMPLSPLTVRPLEDGGDDPGTANPPGDQDPPGTIDPPSGGGSATGGGGGATGAGAPTPGGGATPTSGGGGPTTGTGTTVLPAALGAMSAAKTITTHALESGLVLTLRQAVRGASLTFVVRCGRTKLASTKATATGVSAQKVKIKLSKATLRRLKCQNLTVEATATRTGARTVTKKVTIKVKRQTTRGRAAPRKQRAG